MIKHAGGRVRERGRLRLGQGKTPREAWLDGGCKYFRNLY
jgi:hypothetical protein